MQIFIAIIKLLTGSQSSFYATSTPIFTPYAFCHVLRLPIMVEILLAIWYCCISLAFWGVQFRLESDISILVCNPQPFSLAFFVSFSINIIAKNFKNCKFFERPWRGSNSQSLPWQGSGLNQFSHKGKYLMISSYPIIIKKGQESWVPYAYSSSSKTTPMLDLFVCFFAAKWWHT